MMLAEVVKCEQGLSWLERVPGFPEKLKPRFFAGLAPAELAAVMARARLRYYRAGDLLIDEGDIARRVFMLTSGRARHFVITKSGRKMLLYWVTTGQLVGLAALLPGRHRALSSAEVLDDCCALVWDHQTLRGLAERHRKLLDNVLSIAYTEQIAWLVSAQISLVEDDARGRVAHMLLSLACSIGVPASGGTELEVTNEDLAAGANTTHYTVSRVLNEWQRAGALVKGYGTILLRKPRLLASASAADFELV